jgi:hypothetical protein
MFPSLPRRSTNCEGVKGKFFGRLAANQGETLGKIKLRWRAYGSISPKPFWEIGVSQGLGQFPQFENGIQFLDVGSLSQAVGQVVPSLLIPVQEVQQVANSVGPPLGLTSPVDGPSKLGNRGDSGFQAADVGPLSFC